MAWDDMDPDGAGEPGDMRYDYERTRLRREIEREMRERRELARAIIRVFRPGW
jgi:hypothetical protein